MNRIPFSKDALHSSSARQVHRAETLANRAAQTKQGSQAELADSFGGILANIAVTTTEPVSIEKVPKELKSGAFTDAAIGDAQPDEKVTPEPTALPVIGFVGSIAIDREPSKFQVTESRDRDPGRSPLASFQVPARLVSAECDASKAELLLQVPSEYIGQREITGSKNAVVDKIAIVRLETHHSQSFFEASRAMIRQEGHVPTDAPINQEQGSDLATMFQSNPVRPPASSSVIVDGNGGSTNVVRSTDHHQPNFKVSTTSAVSHELVSPAAESIDAGGAEAKLDERSPDSHHDDRTDTPPQQSPKPVKTDSQSRREHSLTPESQMSPTVLAITDAVRRVLEPSSSEGVQSSATNLAEVTGNLPMRTLHLKVTQDDGAVLNLRLSLLDGRLKVVIATHRGETARMLTEELSTLEGELSRSGFRVREIAIEMVDAPFATVGRSLLPDTLAASDGKNTNPSSNSNEQNASRGHQHHKKYESVARFAKSEAPSGEKAVARGGVFV